MRTEWLRGADALRSLAPAWRALSTDPFTAPEWILPWCEMFAPDTGIEAVTAWRATELVALVPLVRRGNRLEAPVNVHTPYFDIPASDSSARVSVLGELLATEASSIVLDALPADGPTAEWLCHHAAGRRVVARSRHVSPCVDTGQGVDAFRTATRRRWGAPLDRFRRKMFREHEASFHLIQAPNDLDRVLDRGFGVEASGWKGAAGTAITSDRQTERFYRSVAHEFAARGQLALSWLSFGDEMVCFDLDLLVGDTLYLLKTGFDERYRRLAPGLVLRLALIERCIEMGLAAHDLLGDDTEWKRKFALSERRHVELRIYRSGTWPTTQWAYWRFARPTLRRGYAAIAQAQAARRR